MRRRLALAGLALAIGASPPGALIAGGLTAVARADGDPASDVLPGQDVFLPYSAISPAFERRLYTVATEARTAGYPLKIALIATSSDLGVVPALFGKPAAYARFLSAELSGVVNGPVLVVMPHGFGLAAAGRSLSTGPLSAIVVRPGADGLAAAALDASARLAARHGHPLPTASASSPGASPATVRHALLAIAVMGLMALAGVGGAVVARSR